MSEAKQQGLELLRVPFSENQISKLPKPTKGQTDQVKADYKIGIRCTICGGWHHKDVIHLDYVGHAALTDRLLNADPKWSWEPLSVDEFGLPKFDGNGGLWIKLTVCDMTRLGYGDAQGKKGGDAIKECIGDGLRNAAMRFGAALDLWHKGDLHIEEPEKPKIVEMITSDQATEISDLLTQSGANTKKFFEHYKCVDLDNMPKTLYHRVKGDLEKKIEDNKGEKK